ASTNAAVIYTAGTTLGPGTLSVTGTSAKGCTETEGKTITTVDCVDGIAEAIYNTIEVYPSPFTSNLRVTGVYGRVVVYNALGQSVYNGEVRGETTINTADFAKGAYLVQAFNADGA